MNHKQSKRRLEEFKNNHIKKEMKKDATTTATLLLFYVSILVLRDKYGFGKKRLGDFKEYAVTLLDDIQNGLLTINDIYEAIYEETGFKITYNSKFDWSAPKKGIGTGKNNPKNKLIK